MSVPLEMPSSEMNVEAFNASDSDSKIDPPKTAIPKLCTNTTDQIDSTTVATDKLVISKVESSGDKDIDVTVKKDMDSIKCTITAAASSSTAGNSPTSTVTTTDTVAEAPKEEIDGEAVVSTPLDENINAQSNQELPPSTSETVNIAVKIDSNDDDDSKKKLDEKQVNEPLSTKIKTKLDSEAIVKDPINRLSNEKIEDKQKEQQPVLLQKLDDKQKVSSTVVKGGEVAKQGETTIVGKDEQESDEKADSSLEIIENLDDTDKSDEKMDEDEDDDDDEEDGRRVVAMDEDDDEEGMEDDVLGEPLTLDEEEDCEEEVDEEEDVEHETSGNAILIDDEDDDEDADNEEIDEEEVEDEEDIDEDDIEDDEDGGVDNEDDDDIEEVIESDDEVIEEDSDDSEPEEMSQNIKLNSRKSVDKRYGPRFKSKMKRPRNFFAILKRRSIKWLTKKMHVMESDEMISTIPNDLTTPTVGCVSLGGGVKKYKENDYRYNNIKDDEGIDLIEEKDDPHHDDEPSDDDDGGEEDEEMEKTPSKLDDKKNSDSITNKKLNKNDSNVENSIIKNKILKQTDNNNSNSELVRSKSKTPPNVDTSETLDLTSPSPQKNPVQPPELMKTDKEFKNDCNLVKKSAVVQEEQNISNNNNNNNNSSSDKKIKNEENVKLTNVSNDDIEMIEDNQAVDLSQEKQPTQQQIQTQPIELEIIDKDNNKNEKDNKIVASNQKSVKSPNINKTFSSSTVDCDKKLEIKKEEKPYVEPKPHDQQQPLLKTSSSTSSDKSDNKNSNENSSKEDSGDETKKSNSRSTQSGAIKRSSSPTGNIQSVDYSNPSKKHCDDTNSAAANLDQQPVTNNKTTNNTGDNAMLNEFIEKSQNDTPDELKKNIDQIQEEIQSLDEMLKIKEQEWNNVLHLKKMKEEIFERLTRRKRINDIKSILSIGSMDGYNQMIASSMKQNNKAGQGDGAQQQPSIAVATLKDYTSNMNKFSNSASNNALAGIRSSAAQTILQNRANIKTTEQIKDKLNSQRQQRQILPKAPSVATSILQSAVNNNQNKILNYTSTNLNQQKKQSIHQQQQQDYLNGHQTMGQASLSSSAAMGRQGAIKDVQSIIADYRQKHPEEVPRRGRRLRPSFSMNEMSGGEGGRDGNSRPSSADSSHSNSNLTSTPNLAPTNAASNISFKDVLVKYAKMSPSERQRLSTGNSATLLSSLNLTNSATSKAYPEVTLHPLNSTSMNSSAMHSSEPNTNVNSSLLHGILTKNTTRPVQQYNTFSPTLARLLTAPERITPQTSALFHQNSSNSAAGGGGGGTNVASLTNPGVNLTKNHNEITITPVLNNNNSTTTGAGAAGTFLKREAGTEYSGSGNRIKTESNSNLDDEADDSADRLVIDEGDGSPGDQLNMSGTGQEFHENEVPECQGCKKREAQFVCAGCGNQWYCSRECQVRAWDEHSDICTG